jgi:hypothetical protein
MSGPVSREFALAQLARLSAPVSAEFAVGQLLGERGPGASLEWALAQYAGLHGSVSGDFSAERLERLVVLDHFTGADGILLQDHVPNIGGTWELLDFLSNGALNVSATRQLAIYANHARNVAGGGLSASRTYRNAAVPDSAEYDLSCIAFIASPANFLRVQLDARMTPTGVSSAAVDRYEAFLNVDSIVGLMSYGIDKFIGGVYTDLGAFSGISTSLQLFRMRFEVRNTVKKFFINDVEVASTTDNTIAQVGRAGITGPFDAGSIGYIDTFAVANV